MMSDKAKSPFSSGQTKGTETASSLEGKSKDLSGDSMAPLQRFRTFADGLKHGMKVEWHETRAVPGQLLRGEFRKAGEQVADLGRMGFLAALWILPGGALISGFVVKVFHRIRPSAFRPRRHGKHEREEPCD